MPDNPFSYEQIVEMSNEAIWVVGADRRIAYANARGAEIFGRSMGDVIGQPVLELFFPEDRPAMEVRLQRREAGESERYQHRIRRSDGKEVWCLISARPLCEADGRFAGCVAVVSDITELKRAETALRDSEFWLRESQRIARVGSYVFDVRAGVWTSSEVLDDLFGIDPWYPRTVDGWIGIVHPDERPGMAAYLGELLSKKQEFNREYRIVRPNDGAERWVRGHGELTLDADGAPVRMFGIIQDMTDERRQSEERRLLETRLLQAQKLESLGVLAGGIAHEFNNLLTAILGNAELVLQDLPPDSPARDNVRAIERSSRRAAEVSRQMLAYSGRGRLVVEPVVLSELVRDMMRMLDVAVPKKMTLRVDFPQSLPAAEADPDQIRQVVMNLVVNAVEAIGDREGSITISAGIVDSGTDHHVEDYLGETLPAGRYVSLDVADTGSGMSAETRSRVFDPFFSTKFTGRGLGLPAVLGIVRGHRGFIHVESTPERGTTFRVLLPALATSPAGGRRAAGDAPALPPAVLVVDDEEGVRAVAERMIERCGFRTLSAADGIEALRVVNEHPGEIACVILDLTMPRMDGGETLLELRRIRPDLPVILCSGYLGQEIIKRFAGEGLAGFVQKPYQLSELKAKLLAALKGTPRV